MRTERVLIAGARAPAALHLARLLHGAGCYVVLADSLRQCVGFASRACDAKVVLPSANGDLDLYAEALAQAIQDYRITLVIPTCEEVFYLADVWERGDMAATLFAPDIALLAQVHNKFRFVEIARRLDLAVPETRLLQGPDDVDAVRDRSSSLVFKPVWSRFGTDVQVCPKVPDIAPTVRAPWIAQDYVPGKLCSVHAVAHDGCVAAIAGYHPLYQAGHGAGTAFAPLDDPQITDFVTRFATGTGWTGQVSFDFIRDGSDLIAVECNPRATSGLHLFTQPLPFAAAFFGGVRVEPDAQGLHAVKLAMRFYGLWPALRGGLLGQFVKDMKDVTDVMLWPGDTAPRRQQWRAVAEIAGIALRKRVSLQTAATDDIEWNGPD